MAPDQHTENNNRSESKGEQNGESGETPEQLGGLERRDFLKFSATGVFASLAAACTVPVLREPGPQLEKAGSTANAASTAPQLPPIPDVGNLVDPELLQAESWQEQWTWRPDQWPGAPLELNLVQNQSPGEAPSQGNPSPAIFSYNGNNPGPTIRVRNNETLRLKLRNMLAMNSGKSQVGPAPDPLDIPPERRLQVCELAGKPARTPENPGNCNVFAFREEWFQVIPAEVREHWRLGGHFNGQHSAHTTNIHTHGLHVSPDTNPDGTHSDNVFLRVIPRGDFEARKATMGENARLLNEHEHVAELDYTIELGFEHQGKATPHPPGTHWYHPHSHGATHDQVASGMAGFLLVEGDVDEALNKAMTGESWPDPTISTGPWDYRERLILIQRAEFGSVDADAHGKKKDLNTPPFRAESGERAPGMFRMRPGAVERWRVLNGSADGSGTKRFMVLDGQYVQKDQRIWRVVVETSGKGENAERKRRLEPVSEQDFENAKLDIQQLSFDGITLVTTKNGKPVHRIRDLAGVNAGTRNPFARQAKAGESEPQARLAAFEDCFRNGDTLSRAFVRPNEVYLTNANRTDLLFKAPLDSAGRVFTIFAKEAHIHTDNFQQTQQRLIKNPEFTPFRQLFDVIKAYIHVSGEPVEGGDFDIQSLNAHLPPVPPLLLPVSEDELKVPASEARMTGVAGGSRRTRTMNYSGTGGAEFPLIPAPAGFVAQHPELERLVWDTIDGTAVLLPNLTRTMGINPEFDLTVNPNPGPPRKFAVHDPLRPKMLVNTAEEWVVYNCSQMMWSHTDLERFPQPGSFRGHYTSYPLGRADGQRRFYDDPEFCISSKGNDHPFHIHINPMWVLRIDVPDENGELHNILPEPCWMDTVALPRNGGRVIFRSRFDDFTGMWVNHCHVLMHEDNGMMQLVECTDDARQVNYKARQNVASFGMSGSQVDSIYPKPSLELMYRQNMSFIDPSEVGYQEYPGFEFDVPRLEDD